MSGAVVLVHCFEGISRSASVVVAYVLRTNPALDYAAALLQVQQVRPIADPNPAFAVQLPQLGAEPRKMS